MRQLHFDAEIHMTVYYPNPRVRNLFIGECFFFAGTVKIANPGGMRRKCVAQIEVTICKSPEEKQRRENKSN